MLWCFPKALSTHSLITPTYLPTYLQHKIRGTASYHRTTRPKPNTLAHNTTKQPDGDDGMRIKNERRNEKTRVRLVLGTGMEILGCGVVAPLPLVGHF